MTSESLRSQDEEFVVLEIRSPDIDDQEDKTTEASELLARELRDGKLHLPKSHGTVKIRARRNRLVEHSTYFRSLFGGNFKESASEYVIVDWNLATFIAILQFIDGGPIDVSIVNFVPLLEGAFFFGVDNVVMECKNWFVRTLTSRRIRFCKGFLQQLIDIWNFGVDNGIRFILEHCVNCVALNFVEIVHCESFASLPYALLKDCISHPLLTVNSEQQLCEALLFWFANNGQFSGVGSSICGENTLKVLEKVRFGLLPLEFILGPLWREYPSLFTSSQMMTMLEKISHPRLNGHSDVLVGDFECFRLRLTQYSEKLDLSGCQQVTSLVLLLSLLPQGSLHARFSSSSSSEKLKTLFQSPSIAGPGSEAALHLLPNSLCMPSFTNLQEVNISCCWRINENDIVEWLRLSSPSLRVLQAAYCPQLKVSILGKLSQVCPSIEEADFSVDISPVMAHKVSVLHISCEACPGNQLDSNQNLWSQSVLSNLTKLSLKGRTDITDVDLITIAALSHSISVLNLDGCISLTDLGISHLLNSYTALHSLHAACTSFGPLSIKELLRDTPSSKDSHIVASTLAELDLGGCHGIDQSSLTKYMMSACSLSYLSLWDTHLVDEGLCAFKGTSLEYLDICETLVSIPALTYIISRNPNLKVLNARGCKRMSGCSDQLEINDPSSFHAPFGNTSHHGELAQELCKLASLQELAIGWGLSGLILETLKPALGSLKSLAVGLGGSLGQQAWLALPEICPSLECISVCFQVVSDEGIVNVLRNLRHIHTLELQHCLGDLTSQCLSVGAPNLKSLKLDGVARWMTDDDLTSLTQNCRNLCQLSLSGCKFLTSDAQCIIASGWPGLTKIHLEDCGKVTSNGVSNLLNCKAIQDLLLRHNGSGIPRNFISDAAMKLPLLRTLSLDLCDACETGFNTPNYLDRFSLNTVKLACCKFQRRAFELQGFSVRGSDNVQRHCVHKETIVLEWNSKEFRTTIVHERL